MYRSVPAATLLQLLVGCLTLAHAQSPTDFQFPTVNYQNSITFGFGEVNPKYANKLHTGEDIVAPSPGTPVQAAGAGKVMLARPWKSCPNWGYILVIQHQLTDGSNASSIYGHLDPATVAVTEGQTIARGVFLGRTGNYPCWTEHLHFGIHLGKYGARVGSYAPWLTGYLSLSAFPDGYVKPSDFILAHQPPNPTVSVTISPKSITVHSGDTVQFTATVTGTTNADVTWAASAGTISSTGLYTAPNVTAPTIETVVVTSVADTTKSDSAAVTVDGRGSFTPTGNMSSARSQHTATRLPDGSVLVVGGQNDSGFLASAETYDPAVGTFSSTGTMGEARGLHTENLLLNGKVLLAGGFNSISTVASAEVYDPATRTFAATGNMVTARVVHTATLLPSGKVLIVGGEDQNSVLLASAELYDPATGQFAATGSLSAPRVVHTATLLNNGKVLITGGFSVVGDVSLASAELYDRLTGTFTSSTHSMNQRRTSHTATLLPDGKVLIVGGTDGSISGPVLASADLYDPVSDTFTFTTGSMTTAREGHTATLLPSNQVLIAGGFNNDSGILRNAELYDPGTDAFILAGGLGTARFGHRATLLQTGNVLVTGGRGTAGVLSSAEVYTPGP